MPYFAEPVADEHDALLTFLGVPRAALRAAVFGLTDEQARSRPAASALCWGGLVKHAARTERRWVVAGIAGQPLPGLWPIEDWAADFQLTEQETLDGVLLYYAETAELTARIITAIGDLGQPSAVNPEQSVRWVLFHLIQETSRHAGHADIIRETLDGRRAGATAGCLRSRIDGSDPVRNPRLTQPGMLRCLSPGFVVQRRRP